MQELQVSSGSLQAAKRKAEQALATLQEEYDELETESHENGEKLKKAVEQNSRMQSEMVADKERLRGLEKSKVGTQPLDQTQLQVFILRFPLPFQNSLDQQVKDLSTRLNEEVANATKAAKRDAAKLQARVNLRARARMRSLKLGHLK